MCLWGPPPWVGVHRSPLLSTYICFTVTSLTTTITTGGFDTTTTTGSFDTTSDAYPSEPPSVSLPVSSCIPTTYTSSWAGGPYPTTTSSWAGSPFPIPSSDAYAKREKHTTITTITEPQPITTNVGPTPTYTITYVGCSPPPGYTSVPGGTTTGNSSYPTSDSSPSPTSVGSNALNQNGATKSSFGAAGILAVVLAVIVL